MFDTIHDVDLEHLKQNHVRLYYFGLGFIQLKIDETYRLHFYTPQLPAFNEDIHNHRYDFRSRILSGEITNKFHEIRICTGNDTHELGNESCNPDIDAPSASVKCNAVIHSQGTYQEGDEYHVYSTLFHTVEANRCITLLERGPYTREFAQIVTPVGQESVCPFSQKIDEDELWSIIEEELEHAKRTSTVGKVPHQIHTQEEA